MSDEPQPVTYVISRSTKDPAPLTITTVTTTEDCGPDDDEDQP